MGRVKKKEEEKKLKVSVALDPKLLNYYRSLHINLSVPSNHKHLYPMEV